MDVRLPIIARSKNFDIIKLRVMYHINDIENFCDLALKVAEETVDLEDGECF